MALPANWPILALAVTLALVVAYGVAHVVSRAARSVLRAIIADQHVEAMFVDRPRRIVQLVIFLVAAAALSFPALTIAGYRTTVGGSPETLLRWLLGAGSRIAVIAITAYI